ncbi:aspartate/glutamate racemase family protein [Actinoplanes bogorensis]|uniref:Aspartate/glutamate racemase family protein n=1 Tax=Paractinoplanes bogorensis TaxID=1610840 RepID=A0ABS5YUK8_9ACTN|nr:aspartate/glutamate racemase family protein [Actinoplanes bogorensis]MBU2667058.1 aspartate/glutamate racemase family protein [Actinoplanes bogorensis]
MPRILLIDPLGTDMHVERDRRIAQDAVGAGTEVVVRHLAALPVSAYLPAEDVLFSPLLRAVREGAEDGFDAIGIACASDPAVREAKALSRTPVTGPFEAAARVAPSFGRFSVMYPGVASGPGENLPQDANWIRRLAREYGVFDLLGPCAPVPVERPDEEVTAGGPEQARVTGEKVLANMTASIRNAGPAIAERLWRDGEAEAIFVACTFWSTELDPIRKAVPIPILDPIQTLARYTALLATTISR